MSVRRKDVLYRDFSSFPARKDGPFLVIVRHCKLNKSTRLACDYLRGSLKTLRYLNSIRSWNLFLPTLTFSMQLQLERYVLAGFFTVGKIH